MSNSLDDLIEEYRFGLRDLGSADEHLFDEDLTEAQRAWLRDFSRRWEYRWHQVVNRTRSEYETDSFDRRF